MFEESGVFFFSGPSLGLCLVEEPRQITPSDASRCGFARGSRGDASMVVGLALQNDIVFALKAKQLAYISVSTGLPCASSR